MWTDLICSTHGFNSCTTKKESQIDIAVFNGFGLLKVVDMVPHDIILCKLKHYSIYYKICL